MKKFKAFLTLSICLIAGFLFVGCGEKEQPTLSAPSIINVTNEKVVKFYAVENATYYIININNISYCAYLNQNPKITKIDDTIEYDAKDIIHQNTNYVVRVKAGASGYQESAYGNIAYFINSTKLSKPTVEVVGTTVTWEPVEKAEYYNVKVVLPSDEENAEQSIPNQITYKVWGKNYFDFKNLLTEVGEYQFYVNAGSTQTYVNESDFSDATTKSTYKKYVQLVKPTNTKIHFKNGKYYLVSIIDEHTTDLRITVDGVEAILPLTSEHVKADETLTNFVEVDLTSLFVSTDLTKNKDYNFAIQNLGGNYYTDSAILTEKLKRNLNIRKIITEDILNFMKS